jgi:hypothetical protein
MIKNQTLSAFGADGQQYPNIMLRSADAHAYIKDCNSQSQGGGRNNKQVAVPGLSDSSYEKPYQDFSASHLHLVPCMHFFSHPGVTTGQDGKRHSTFGGAKNKWVCMTVPKLTPRRIH